MAKSTPNDSLETVARLLDIVPFLTTHQGIAIEELAGEFSVSVDQITKDLTTLWMCGLPGYTAYELIDLSFDTGFVTISNAETLERPRALNRDEVLALLLGLESLREDVKDSDSHLVDLVAQAITRLTTLIGSVASRSVQAGHTSDSELLALCQQSISNRTALEIDYHSAARDDLTHRIVHPFDISSDSKYTYLHAYCESSQGNRTFRLDRIDSAIAVNNRASSNSRVAGPTAETSFDAELSIASRKRDIAEKLNIAQPFSALEDHIVMRCFSPDWAVREVMSFGGAVQVCEPPTLRQLVLERASRALSGYGN
jgi:proteasome accessory factor C